MTSLWATPLPGLLVTVYQESSEAGAFSGLAMGLSGLLTSLCLPFLVRLLGLG